MATAALWVPDRRDVIWIDNSPHFGKEMRDLHPFLVLSPKAFNERTSIVIGLPMTSSETNADNPLVDKFTGTDGKVSFILSFQPKSFDWRARGATPHKMKQAPLAAFEACCETLNQIIAIA